MTTQADQAFSAEVLKFWDEFEKSQREYIALANDERVSTHERVKAAHAANEAHRQFMASLPGGPPDKPAMDRLDCALEAITFAHSVLLTVERAGLFDWLTGPEASAGVVLIQAAQDRLSAALKQGEAV